MTRILILCTGNSCRSQMAEYVLKSLNPSLQVYSAGTNPAMRVHPKAVAVMREIGIDLAGAHTKSVDQFLGQPFDYAITVCDNARESCPAFTGKVNHRLHIRFDDPAETAGTEEEIMAAFRQIRDAIRLRFISLYDESIRPAHSQ